MSKHTEDDQGKVAANDVDVKDVNAKDIDAKDVDAKDVDAKDVDAKDVDAKDLDAKDVDAKDVDAKDVATGNVKTKDAGESSEQVVAREADDGRSGQKDARETVDSSSGDMRKTVDGSSGDTRKTVDSNSGDTRKTVDSSSGDTRKTVDSSSGDTRKTVDSSAGDAQKMVDGNSGDAQKTVDGSSVDASTLDDSGGSAAKATGSGDLEEGKGKVESGAHQDVGKDAQQDVGKDADESGPGEEAVTAVECSGEGGRTGASSGVTMNGERHADETALTNGKVTRRAVKGSDSDKENGDAPMDLSTGRPGSDDVTSDDAPDARQTAAAPPPGVCTADQARERKRLVKRLREELRNEDAKFVLLKKIRHSQLMEHLHEASKPSVVRQPASAPPPLIRGQPAPAAHAAKVSAAALLRIPGQHQSRGQPVLQSTGPPPLVMAQRAPANMLSLRDHHTLMAGYRPSPPQPEQTPAQRQAAAKLALRKQLEKTLLQIPPPKPPPPEMNFMPSLSGNEFIMLAGLEEVVKYIVDTDVQRGGGGGGGGAGAGAVGRADIKYVFNPFVCVQCGTDFTPVWKRDKPGSKSVICELCVTTNQKKALKQEHTNRLKSAFVKALQQEQEIEQRIQVAPASAATSGATTTTAAPINLSTGFKPTSEQMRQHQSLLQAHQAQLRATQPGSAAAAAAAAAALGLQAFNPRSLPYAFQAPAAAAAALANMTKADIHRQYLLDMIPRSLPGNTVLWRT